MGDRHPGEPLGKCSLLSSCLALVSKCPRPRAWGLPASLLLTVRPSPIPASLGSKVACPPPSSVPP